MGKLVVLLCTLLAAACAGPSAGGGATANDSAPSRVVPREDLGPVLGWVGEQPLTSADLEDVINSSGQAGRATGERFDALVEDAVGRKLLVSEALRRS